MERLDEAKLLNLLEWLEEASGEEDEEPTRDDSGEPAKSKKWAIPGDEEGQATPVKKFGDKPQAGHKRINPHDMSGDNPEENPVKSQMSPKLAGERAKAIMVLGRVEGFIEKYSELAVDKFSGASHSPGGFALGGGVRKGAETKGAGDRAGTIGNVKSMSQMMSKEKVMALIEKLPMMPSSQMTFATRAIGNYIWRIHATARETIRDSVKGMLSKQKGGKVRSDDPSYGPALEAASREFEKDSVNVKGDLNMLAAVSGLLKRSGGFGGPADKTFLKKVIKGYTDKEGNFHIKGVDIVPQESDVALPPELAALATAPEKEEDDEDESPKSSKSKKSATSTKAKGPTIRKANKEAVDHYIDEMIEYASANFTPQWWNEL